MATSEVTQPRILPNRRILRYTFVERIMHWVAALSYIYVLISGLSFWSPKMYWLATLLGGGPTARFWHPFAGLLFTASAIWMYKSWHGDMKHTKVDDAWDKTIKAYVTNDDDHVAPAGRFNSGQKQFFWVMFYAALALLVTGLVMWFVEYVPGNLGFVRGLSVLLHAIAALFTIGAFIIHVYMGTAVVREGFSSVIRGEVSEDWARTHHPLWLNEIKTQRK